MTQIDRRSVVAGLAGAAVLLAEAARAGEAKKDEKQHTPDAPPAAAPDPRLTAIVDSTAACLAAARVCLARCTDHLAAGMKTMAACQKATMNMIAVCEAMAAVATYRTADGKNCKALAATCALFCRACEKECALHAAHHEECKACGDACKACATACEAFAAA